MAVHAQDQEAGPGEERNQLDGSSMKCHLVNARAQVRSAFLLHTPSDLAYNSPLWPPAILTGAYRDCKLMFLSSCGEDAEDGRH